MRSFLEPAVPSDALTVVNRELPVQLVNCSVSGCLLATRSPIDVGTVATLNLLMDGRRLSDTIRVVRCQPIEGSGSIYHIGAQFLWTSPPAPGSIRYAVHYGAATAEAAGVGIE